jgi:hypothetical protein
VDEIVLFSPSESERPASVAVAGGSSEYAPQRVRVTLDAKAARTLSVTVTASRSSHARIDLLTLSNEATRSLSAVSSDLGLTGPAQFTLDGRGGSRWTTTHANAWLLFALPAGTRSLRLTLCATGRPDVAFGSSLGSWTPPVPASEQVDLPPGTRFALLRWAAGGCLAELSPQA